MEFYETIKNTRSFIDCSNHEVSNFGNVRMKGTNQIIERREYTNGLTFFCFDDANGKLICIDHYDIYRQINEMNGIYDMCNIRRTKFRKFHTSIKLSKFWYDNDNKTKTAMLNIPFVLKTLKLSTIEIHKNKRMAGTTYSKQEIKKMKIPYGTTVLDGSDNRLNLSNYDEIFEDMREPIRNHEDSDSDDSDYSSDSDDSDSDEEN
jgi:hypothetical protein